MGKEIHVIKNQDLFVPHRIVKVGQAVMGSTANTPVAPDTVKDPVGRRALAKANEAVRDLPKRHRIFKVGQASESSGAVPRSTTKIPSMMPAKTGDLYPGEHRYAYQISRGDTIHHIGDPNPLIGRWVKIEDIEITWAEDKGRRVPVHIKFTGTTEPGNRVVLEMQGNAQVRLVTNKKEPTK
jgi:hypothetical protein